ncbi:MAG: hypothetical protein NUW37_12555 [Planctomycetes bacterium]|nr:hypothetical protein [Planctomycetota bacterium]
MNKKTIKLIVAIATILFLIFSGDSEELNNGFVLAKENDFGNLNRRWIYQEKATLITPEQIPKSATDLQSEVDSGEVLLLDSTQHRVPQDVTINADQDSQSTDNDWTGWPGDTPWDIAIYGFEYDGSAVEDAKIFLMGTCEYHGINYNDDSILIPELCNFLRGSQCTLSNDIGYNDEYGIGQRDYALGYGVDYVRVDAVRRISRVKTDEVESALREFVTESLDSESWPLSTAEAITILSKEFGSYSFDELEAISFMKIEPFIELRLADALQYVPPLTENQKDRWVVWIDRASNYNVRYLLARSFFVCAGEDAVEFCLSLIRRDLAQIQDRWVAGTIKGLIFENLIVRHWEKSVVREFILENIRFGDRKTIDDILFSFNVVAEKERGDFANTGIIEAVRERALSLRDASDAWSAIEFTCRYAARDDIGVLMILKDRFPEFAEYIDNAIEYLR